MFNVGVLTKIYNPREVVVEKGMFCVLEGPDGAGKGTIAILIKELLGDRVVMTREPGGSPYAEEIRHVALKSVNAKQADGLVIFLLMWAARVDHILNTILPALKAGKIVVTDRFNPSTLAFNVFGQERFDLEWLFWILSKIVIGKTKPDFYIYLEVDSTRGLARKKGQGPLELNHFDDRDVDFQDQMRAGYKEFFSKVTPWYQRFLFWKEPYVYFIDANRPIEEVWQDVLIIFDKRIGK